MIHDDARPALCAHPGDAPPDADVFLRVGAVTVAAHAAVLAARSPYFAALLAWPVVPAPTSATPADDAARDDAGQPDRNDPPCNEATAATVAAVTAAVTTTTTAAATAAAENAPGDKDDATTAAAGTAPRDVELHGVAAETVTLALRALYGLPWAALWDEVLEVHELLDAWQAPPDARSDALRRLSGAFAGARPAPVPERLLALAWNVERRPLSEAARDVLLETAARRPEPFGGAAWGRVDGPTAARFLAHPALRVPEREVLRATLGWARAAPRTDAELAAVSGAVRYGALDETSLAGLWQEPDVPTAMLLDAGRLMAYENSHLFAAGLYATRERIARYLPRVPAAEDGDIRRGAVHTVCSFWRVRCADAEHHHCERLLLPMPNLCYMERHLRMQRSRHVVTQVLRNRVRFSVTFATDGDVFLAKVNVSDVQRQCSIRIDGACSAWQRDFIPGAKCDKAPLFGVCDVASHACRDACALRSDASFPVLELHVVYLLDGDAAAPATHGSPATPDATDYVPLIY